MDLTNITMLDVERGINHSMSSTSVPSGHITNDAAILADIYGFMVWYRLNNINLQAYVEDGNIFSQKHAEAVLKNCS